MNCDLLEILRCPFCGSSLELDESTSVERRDDEIVNGLIACQCSAYPVVDGIPVLLSDYTADQAREHLTAGEYEQALFSMLGLDDEERQASCRRYIAKGKSGSYSEGVEILCPDAEGIYFVYRFSDPTYLVGQRLIRAVGSDKRCFSRRAIDLCGGSGHLTRVLCECAGESEVVLADAYFWKLWMAKRITAPDCRPVCCDANNPLPFARDAFSLAVCSDAFHYIWSKRLLSSEMMRLTGDQGVIILSHIHNALVDNFSAGMPLAPEWWRNLFAEMDARVFKESEVFESFLNHAPVDLSIDYSDEQLRDEQALFLIATKLEGLFRVYPATATPNGNGKLRINPLYRVEQNGGNAVLRIQFPSEQYEEEFGACMRYLPERIEFGADELKNLEAGALSGGLKELADLYVLIELPEGYL
jgi:uncharacterized protein YbaR (Trm112 family)/SAM-dependent methyltransferase